MLRTRPESISKQHERPRPRQYFFSSVILSISVVQCCADCSCQRGRLWHCCCCTSPNPKDCLLCHLSRIRKSNESSSQKIDKFQCPVESRAFILSMVIIWRNLFEGMNSQKRLSYSYIARPAFRGPDLRAGTGGSDQKMNPSAFRISLSNLKPLPLGSGTKTPSLLDF